MDPSSDPKLPVVAAELVENAQVFKAVPLATVLAAAPEAEVDL